MMCYGCDGEARVNAPLLLRLLRLPPFGAKCLLTCSRAG